MSPHRTPTIHSTQTLPSRVDPGRRRHFSRNSQPDPEFVWAPFAAPAGCEPWYHIVGDDGGPACKSKTDALPQLDGRNTGWTCQGCLLLEQEYMETMRVLASEQL